MSEAVFALSLDRSTLLWLWLKVLLMFTHRSRTERAENKRNTMSLCDGYNNLSNIHRLLEIYTLNLI